jgi:hypothetical protein
MADSVKDRGPRDRSRVNIHQEYEIRYWSRKFDVTPEQLKEAVQKVGVSARAVAEELGKPPAA